ncbi:unnamed protein product [Candida verbasci]|uniref:C2H2-type domain-containing protein n=1 Tax=Candida verbasci TaxID=1227364 RepID=A0A9W4TX58_9ASCO|nr:unnamed protein product [Candida verbasci]
MTASAQYNYNRRNSSTTSTPYTIPTKHHHHHHPHSNNNHHHHPHHHRHINQQPQNQGLVQPQTITYNYQQHDQQHPQSPPLSASVPTLSREFVVRRISEGETGRLKEELRCEACGKGYKHISSLAKHLWEHTPEWNVTKKLLISKHQQVQLLEAASILVGMNENQTHSPSNPNFHRRTQSEQHNSAPPVFSNSNTPTPPKENDELFKDENDEEHSDVDSATSSSSGSNIKLKLDRSLSVSQHPPNHELEHPMSPTMNMNGFKRNSIGNIIDTSLKSPMGSTTNTESNLNTPISAHFKTPTNGKDNLFEDGVIEKMED